MSRCLLGSLVLTLVVAPSASAAISNATAAKRAVAALHAKQGSSPVIVFRSGAALGSGAVISQAGSSAAPSGKRSKTGVVTTPTKAIFRVAKGHRAYLFYADQAPYQAYAHRGHLALVDAGTGKVRVSPTLSSPPVIDGRLPFYMRTNAAYRDPKNHVFSRAYKITTAAAGSARTAQASLTTFRIDRAPIKDLSIAKAAADQLAADHACSLRVSDTYGEFYDFTGADQTRARVGDLFFQLSQLNPGFIDQRYSRTSGVSPLGALDALISTKGCKDILLYVAGRGFSSGSPTTVGIGTRVTETGVRQQLLRAAELQAFIAAHPSVNFSVTVDAPYSKGVLAAVAGDRNVLIAESGAGATGASFGYLPEVFVNGTRIANTGNPNGLLEFTNRVLSGMNSFLSSSTEVNAAIAARRDGSAPSFLAVLLGRAYSLGEPDDLPAVTGIQRPLFTPTFLNPNGPPPAPATQTPAPQPPVASDASVSTPEDTPLAIALPGSAPAGTTPTYSIDSGPQHGTLSGTGQTRTYTPAKDYAGQDSFTFSIAVGALKATGTVSITVTPVDDPAVVTTSAGSPTFTEGGGAISADPTLTVADVDDDTLTGARVAITAGRSADDVLGFTPQAGITGAYDASTGVLTFSGTAPVVDYQAVLRSITFAITGANPAAGTRTLSYQAADGQGLGPVATRAVSVVVVDDAPVLTGTPATLAYTENDPATAVGPGIAIVDPDSPTMHSATVAITGGYVAAEDRLAFTATGGITGAFDTATGVLTLTGEAPTATYAAALAAVTYANLGDDPTTAPRTLTFRVDDGQLASNAVTSQVTVTAVNDAPVVTTSSGSTDYTENAAAVAVDPTITVTDADDTSLTGATVSLTTGFQPGEDVLAFTTIGSISGTYNGLTGVLTLSGAGTVAAYQAALRTVTYADTSDDPSAAARTVSFTATDGTDVSAAATRGVTVTPVDDAPTVSTTAGSATYTEGASPAVIDAGIAVADVDSTTLASATIAITNNFVSGDALTFVDGNGITGSYASATGVLTLSGSASVASYAAALASITYSTTNDDPTAATRTVSFTVSDGTLASATATRGVAVTPTNDPPTVTTSSDAEATYTEGQAGSVVIDGGITVADPDDTTLASATVTIAPGDLVSGDTLATHGILPGGVTPSYDAATGVLTITGTATVTQYQTILAAITYANTRTDLSDGSRSVSFAVSDGAASSTPASKTVHFDAIDTAPTLVAGADVTTWTEGSAPEPVAPTLTATDVDNANLAGATAAITTNAGAGDRLDFATQNGISGTFDPATFTLTLTGTATVAQYQAALRSIAYESTDDDVSPFTRTISYSATDGELTSAAVTHDIAVVPTDDAPTVTTSSDPANTYAEAAATGAIVDASLTVTDPDSTALVGATAQITTGLTSGDVLGVTVLAGVTASYDAATGRLTLTGSAPVSEYETILRSVTFSTTRTDLGDSSRTVTFKADDGTLTSAGATHAVNFAAVNSAPSLTTSGGSTAYTEGAAAVAIDTALTVADADDTNQQGAHVTIVSPVLGDTLGFTAQNNISGSFDAATGVLTLSGTDTVAHYQSALRSVTFSNTTNHALTSVGRTIRFTVQDPAGATSVPATKTVAVTAVNDAPTVTLSSSVPAFTEGDPALTIDAGVSVTDPDSASLASAEVKLTNPVAGDTLALAAGYTLPAGISVAGASTATDLQLTGAAPLADYTAALAHVTFFTASANPTGTTRVARFTATDTGSATSSNADKFISVTDVNSAPVAVTDAFTTNETTVATGNVRTNDTDPDDATGTLVVDRVAGSAANVGTQITLPSGALVTISSAGAISYDPNHAFDALQVGGPNGTDSVTYRVVDPHGATSNTATVTFTITPVNTAPTAPTSTFNALRNTALEVKDTGSSIGPKVHVTGDLLAGASDPDDTTLTVTVQTISSANGGSVDLAADGTFVYVSNPASASASDHFTYQLNDAHGGHTNVTVNVNLQGHYWYVDPSAPTAGANGTSLHPYTTLTAAEADANSSTGDQIYVAAGTVSGASSLKTNQSLIGQGSALQATLTTDGDPTTNDLPVGPVTVAAAGTRPVLNASGAAVLTLGTGTSVQGLNIDPDGTADGINGASTGTTTITNVAVNDQGTATTGDGIDISGASSNVTMTNVDVTTNGSGVALKLANGTFAMDSQSDINATGGPALSTTNVAGGTLAPTTLSTTNSSTFGVTVGGSTTVTPTMLTIQNPATTGLTVGGAATFTANAGTNTINASGGTAFSATSGSGSVSLGGAIVPDAGVRAVDVQSRTAGAITVGTGITTTGTTGINVQNNTGGTVTFSGSSQSITAGASTGVTVSTNTGATVNFTGGGLAISTTSGTGMLVTGGGTVTVTGTGNTIASTGGGTALGVSSTQIGAGKLIFKSISTSNATNGITVVNTGSAGGLHVTGTGTTAGSGGTISGATGSGVVATATADLSLANMTITNSLDHGVNGTNVNGITLTNDTITGSGNATGENNVELNQLSGTSSIANSTIGSPDTNNIHVRNTSGSATLGITGNTISMDPTRADQQNDSILIEGAGTMNATIANNGITGAAGDHIEVAPSGAAAWTADVNHNTLSSSLTPQNGEDLGGGISLAAASLTGTFKYKVDDNSVVGDEQGAAISAVQLSGTGAVNGEIKNNTLGTQGTPLSASRQGNGIAVDQGGEGAHTVLIDGNTVDGYANAGIILTSGQGPTADTNTGTLLNATVTNNTVRGPATSPVPAVAGIYLDSGVNGTQSLKTCLLMNGNTVRDDTFSPSLGSDVRLTQDSPSSVILPGYAGGPTDTTALATYTAPRNGTLASHTSFDTSNGTYTGGAACTLPTLF
ncbi:MAG: tandem-95 repeat protein [Patulibacter sp.]|nr:tandem-95 repeat protein [Patulibacter sp.]